MGSDPRRSRGNGTAAIEQAGSPPGSLRYFSVLFAPPQRRPLLDALYAFEAEIRGSLLSSNHDVAHTRLQWWRGEVDRLAAGRPQHPVTTRMIALRECASGDLSLLHEVLAAADLDLACMTYANWQELEAYCFRAAGSLQILAAAAVAGVDALGPGPLEFARQLGSTVRQTEMLRDLADDLARGRLYVPLAALVTAGIEPAQVASRGPSPLQPVVAEWRARLERSFASLGESLTPLERRTLRPGLVLGALHQRLLARIQVGERPTARAELPPWTRLWTAWRTAVRYG